MRILQVTPYYEQAWAYGGIPRVVGALCGALVERGHQVTVCTTDVRDEGSRLKADERTSTGARLRIFPNVSNRLAYHLQLFLPVGMDRALKDSATDYDLAHLHGCHHLPGAISARRLGLARIPYVLTTHGTALRIERRRLAKWVFDHTVGRGVLSKAARVIAVSGAEVRQLQQLKVPDAAIRVIPNPIDLAQFSLPPSRGAFRTRAGLGDRPLVLFLGKLTPRKGLPVLARAFAALAHPSAVLVVAGNDLGAGADFDALARELAIDVRRVGLLRGSERLEALADADVVVYPSSDEVFGLVPLEAILCGTSAIVADDSGCGELIARLGGGLVTREGDPSSLRDAISRVLADVPFWKATAVAAQPAIRAQFAPEVIGEQHERLYREVLG